MTAEHLKRRLQRALPEIREQDLDRFQATACFAAEACQRDLGCPFVHSCSRVGALHGDG